MGLEVINKIKKEKGLTNEELAEKSGVPLSTLNKITSGATKDPKLGTLQAIAKVLECTIDDFDDVPIKKSKTHNFYLESSEQTHIKKYRVLDEHGRNAVDAILNIEHARIEETETTKKNNTNFTASKINFKDEPRTVERKVYLEEAAAGLGNYLTGEGECDLMTFPADKVPSKADFGIKISGDSMEPKIYNEDIVWVEASHQIENGEIGIFILNNEAYCKKLHIDYDRKIVELISLNTKYKPIEIKEYDDLRTVGKVLFC